MATQFSNNIRMTCTMHKVSQIPEDAVVTTWYFGSYTLAAADLFTKAHGLVSAFWNTAVPAVGQNIAHFLSPTISRQPAALTYDGYNAHAWESLVLGPPFATVTDALDPISAGTEPGVDEVACVLSYHSSLAGLGEGSEAGPRPRARHRGRLYIGPLDHARCVSSNTTNTVFLPNFTQCISEAALRLMQNAGGDWCQFSRTERSARQVTGGFVDNAPDIQRRRGIKATLRNVWGDQPTGP